MTSLRRATALSPWSIVLSLVVAGAAGACSGGSSGGDVDGGAEGPDASATTDGAPREDASPNPIDASTADTSPVDASSTDGGEVDASAGDGGPSDASVADGSMADASDAAPPVITDPFDPRSCDGPAIDAAMALAKLGGAPRSKLADATLMRRDRTCTGADPATCGPWGAPVPHTQALLTYSGGVVTDYKTFAFPTHLVLYTQNGQPRFSVRHTSDYQHDANASARGVVFSFGATPMVNTYPIIYVWDFAPAPNRYDDLQGLLGQRAELHAAATCARFVATSGVSREIAAVYRY
ncbi:MAG: hypothetical protein U0183_16110 [Polyangiaceae bacterium]